MFRALERCHPSTFSHAPDLSYARVGAEHLHSSVLHVGWQYGTLITVNIRPTYQDRKTYATPGQLNIAKHLALRLRQGQESNNEWDW